MSQEVLDQVLRRASSDAQFRGRLQTDFEGALRGYELTPEEKEKLSAAADLGIRSAAVPESQAASGDTLRSDSARSDAARADMARSDVARNDVLSGDVLRGETTRSDAT